MAEYINKEDLKFLEIPIAPVLQGEQVHYEQGFLKEWLENVSPADVVERKKIDKAIKEMEIHIKCNTEPKTGKVNILGQGQIMMLDILKRNIEKRGSQE